MLLFFLVPFGFVLKDRAVADRHYLPAAHVPVFDLSAGWDAFRAALAALSFDNFRTAGLRQSHPVVRPQPRRGSRIDCHAAGDRLSMAYGAGAPTTATMAAGCDDASHRSVLDLVLIVSHAWINILQHDGLLNELLLSLRDHAGQAGSVACDGCNVYIGIDLFVLSVHDSAALCDAVEDGRRAAQ